MSEPVFDPRAESVLARAIYPTAWTSEPSVYEPRSAIEHTRAALRGLSRAGFQVCRNRLGAGHVAPKIAPLLAALEAIRDGAPKDGGDAETLKAARKLARETLENAA